MSDKYIIDVIPSSDKQLYISISVNAIENIRNKISELNEMVANEESMPTMTEPYQVVFYIKDILNIPQRKNQDPNIDGKSGESYYITFIPINQQDIVVELRLTDHQRSEGYSDSYDKTLHPNTRATSIVAKDDAEVARKYVMPPHECNGCRIRRIYQSVPTKVYGTPEQVIQHLNTLICLFQNGHFGKYKDKTGAVQPKASPQSKQDKRNNKNNLNCNINMKQIIRLTEGDLRRMIKNSVNEAIEDFEEEDKWKDYDPFINGDASWLDGEYDIPYGYHVTINTHYGYVAIDDPSGGEETSYFLQGEEGYDLIEEICIYWNRYPNLNAEQAINHVISHTF